MRISPIILGIITATVVVSGVSYAQIPSGTNPNALVITDPLVLSLTPEYPQPNSDVVVDVDTAYFDVDASTIAWKENGRLVEEGPGKKEHTVRLGPPGSKITVSATVTNLEGITYEKSIVIRPQAIDLVWESPSTVPPFYKGKPLYTMLGTIVVHAIPEVLDSDGIRIPAKELYYTWKKNNVVFENDSGYGKSTLTLSDPIYRTPFFISVEVTDKTREYLAYGSLSVNEAQPIVYLYENSPLYGILFNNAVLDQFLLKEKEVEIEAFPYHFNSKSRNDLTYTWVVGNQDGADFKEPRITLRNVDNVSGSSLIFLAVTNGANFLQAFKVYLGITFQASNQ